MSSVTRSFSQIGAREKFLIGIRIFDASSNPLAPEDDLVTGFTVTASASVGNGGVYTSAEVQTLPGYVSTTTSIVVGKLYRDLGKEIVVIGTDEKYLARFRLARVVNNATAAGIGADVNVWLKVWSAAGTGVAVARTG